VAVERMTRSTKAGFSTARVTVAARRVTLVDF